MSIFLYPNFNYSPATCGGGVIKRKKRRKKNLFTEKSQLTVKKIFFSLETTATLFTVSGSEPASNPNFENNQRFPTKSAESLFSNFSPCGVEQGGE